MADIPTIAFDSLAHDTVTAARVPPEHMEREASDLAHALRLIAAQSRANGLDEGEVADEAQTVARLAHGSLALRYVEAPAP